MCLTAQRIVSTKINLWRHSYTKEKIHRIYRTDMGVGKGTRGELSKQDSFALLCFTQHI